jgi:hypothetical protein
VIGVDVLDSQIECLSVLFKAKNAEASNDTCDAKVVMICSDNPIAEGCIVILAPVDMDVLSCVSCFESVELQNAGEGFLKLLT